MKHRLQYLIFSIIFLILTIVIKKYIPSNLVIEKEKVDSISNKPKKTINKGKFQSKNYWENRYKTGGIQGLAHIRIWPNSRPKL